MTLDSGDVDILGRIFRVFGHKEDAWWQDIKARGWYHEFNLERLRPLIPRDGICLDLGANIGMITLAMSELVGSAGRIFADEASFETSAALRKTLEANTIENVQVYSHVMGGRWGELVRWMDVPGMRSSGSALPLSTGEAIMSLPAAGEDRHAVTVDWLIGMLELPRLDLIKIDVEGSELDVLRGATRTLSDYKPLVLLEFNSYAFVHLREITPRRALREILDTFPEVYFFDNRTGPLMRLEDSENSREAFLNHNLLNGLVDDLLCAFKAITQKEIE